MSVLLDIRPTQIYDLPLPVGAPILHPEQVVLRFGNGKTIDVGVLCYMNREFIRKIKCVDSRNMQSGRLADLTTFEPRRVPLVRQLIALISEEHEHSGLRAETLRDTYSRFLAFMVWADSNGWQECLADAELARPVFGAYLMHLRERVRLMEVTINSAAQQQMGVLRVLEKFHGIEDIGREFNLMRKDAAAKLHTQRPCETAQAKVLSLCESLFKGICDLVLTPRPYPYGIKMPRYLGLPDDTLWAFPSISWFMTPAMEIERPARWCPGWSYSYSQGRLATLAELQAINRISGLENFASNCNTRRRSMLTKARVQLAAANDDPQHCQRRQLAYQAMNAFSVLFLAETGMNWAQIVELSWDDAFEVSSSHQGFRTVKWRANRKQVSFELPVNFMPMFKQYLAIRKYLLLGGDYGYLFFRQGSRGHDAMPAPQKSGLNATYRMLRRIDPTLLQVNSREWRAAKSDWLVRNTDPSTAALVLQNTEKTMLESYAEGTETTHFDEMSSFLSQVSAMVVSKDEPIEGGVPRAVGVCSSYGAPAPAEPGDAQPDCKGPEGCLFCNKFKVHADEQDARKLLSCRFCLRLTAPMIGSNERLAGLLTPIFDRIECVLVAMDKLAPGVVAKVEKEVDVEGELDPYWARKYEMLVDLGVVT